MSELQTRSRQTASFWRHNPILAHLLGLSPVLAVSTSLSQGLALGIATAVVLLATSLAVSLLPAPNNASWRFASGLMMLALFTTALEALLQWLWQPLYRELGVYVALICCNFALLTRLQDYSAAGNWRQSAANALHLGAAYLLGIAVVAACRELLLSGTLLQDWQLLWPGRTETTAPAADKLIGFMALQPAAFILLGLLIAAKNALATRLPQPQDLKPGEVVKAKRARISVKL